MVLEDGRVLKLLGIAMQEPPPEDAGWPEFLERLTNHSSLGVLIAGEKDRWGRYGAQVFVRPDEAQSEAWLQGYLLATGAARLLPEGGLKDCWPAMKAEEDQARIGKLGVWSKPDAVQKSSEPKRILEKRGLVAMVEGKIVAIGESPAVFYLNFGQSWRNDFTVIILKRQSKQFESSGIHIKDLVNHTIRVRGVVDGTNGPRIEASLPEQIEKLD